MLGRAGPLSIELPSHFSDVFPLFLKLLVNDHSFSNSSLFPYSDYYFQGSIKLKNESSVRFICIDIRRQSPLLLFSWKEGGELVQISKWSFCSVDVLC